MKMKLATLFSAFILSASLAFANPDEKTEQEAMININTATAEEMDEGLKGVSMKKAEAIVKHREEHGKFKSAAELTEVKGIGDKTVEWNERRIIID